MAFDGREQDAIIELMHGKYAAIVAIETEWGIRFSEGDMRARIEHFHDAVRALTSGEASMYEKHSRLSVEHLAYDLSCLRQIREKPIGHINRTTDKSLSTALVKQHEAGAGIAKLPPQGVRAELVQFYREYTVFFAALFAPVADRNFKARTGEVDASVADIGLIEEVLKKLIAGALNPEQALHELNHVERDDLRERIQIVLARKKLTAAEKHEALAMIKSIEQGMAKEKKAIDQAHLNYTTGQLAVYEDAKDLIKRMAAGGLNLAGKFLQNAVQAAQSRGRGL